VGVNQVVTDTINGGKIHITEPDLDVTDVTALFQRAAPPAVSRRSPSVPPQSNARSWCGS
jgi:hypothetical protein